MSAPVLAAANELREFMFERVYLWEGQLREAHRAGQVVHFLFEHFSHHPEAIGSEWQRAEDSPIRRAAGFVSGMTDRYAMESAVNLGFSRSELPAEFPRR